ncbi:phage holin family protein [[Mycobacterium] nativiensis]|uniref:Phage holin family protein n=1 Tax=[Mycobacterium] nativiensis TaxID=2855503 RepID=A0ABU5Y3S1_9MYCO|nr:phage holin family protein [Mycolicibacter sp. MYC340]MEB3034833.1 phage holin family protein [Mycolicibacter sp. MYC340]
MSKADRRNARRATGKADRNGVPNTLATIPLADPHALPADPSLGELVKDATAQLSTLVRAEVELARAEITRDVKKGLTGSVFFIAALVVLFYSTFFFFFFVAELLDTWLQTWAAYLIVFGVMLAVTLALALLGFLRVRRIRGPRQTIESVRETRDALRPDPERLHSSGPHALGSHDGRPTTDPSGW